jgi:hypothetical protein
MAASSHAHTAQPSNIEHDKTPNAQLPIDIKPIVASAAALSALFQQNEVLHAAGALSDVMWENLLIPWL